MVFQSCAWFSAVDVDHVLRKEVNMDCVTPSQPVPIPHGISQTITDTLSSLDGGSLFKGGRPMSDEETLPQLRLPEGYSAQTPSGTQYRSNDLSLLLAQNATSERDLKKIERETLSGQEWDWTLGHTPPVVAPTPKPKKAVRTPRVVSPPSRSSRSMSRSQGPVTSLPLRRAPDVASR